MTDDVVLNKKESIERCISQIRAYRAVPSELPFSEDHLKLDAIAINLQRAVEQCIDLANHAVRVRALGIPKRSADAFGLLAEARIIDADLKARLIAMVGFRNVLVHEYQKLDTAILEDVIARRLDDLVVFTNRILAAA